MAIVGQINASPSISIAFKTLATTAIQRSERGTVCLILQDTKATEKWYTFKTIADVETEKWDKDNIKYINLGGVENEGPLLNFKKKFHPEIRESCNEFDLPVSKLYYLIKFALKHKKTIRKFIKK